MQYIVSIQLNIVTGPTYPDKFIGDNVVAPSVLLSVVIVSSFCRANLLHWRWEQVSLAISTVKTGLTPT